MDIYVRGNFDQPASEKRGQSHNCQLEKTSLTAEESFHVTSPHPAPLVFKSKTPNERRADTRKAFLLRIRRGLISDQAK